MSVPSSNTTYTNEYPKSETPRTDFGYSFVYVVFEDERISEERISEVRNSANGSDLWRSQHCGYDRICDLIFQDVRTAVPARENDDLSFAEVRNRIETEDRKSTRLNSSHVRISYAVFCLKKKSNMT